MSKIKNEDLGDSNSENKKLTAEEIEQVKGGAGFLKIGDIQGESLKIGDIKGESLKIGDIKGESLESQQSKFNNIKLERG